MLLSILEKIVRHTKVLVGGILIFLSAHLGFPYNIPTPIPTPTPIIRPTASPKTTYKQVTIAHTPSPKTPIPVNTIVLPTPTPVSILMPNNPYIASFCDNLGNCVHSQLADKESASYQSSFPTIHVGQTLTFTVRLVNPTSVSVLAAFLPYSSKGVQDWGTNLTYSKTFTSDDVNTTQYYVNVYIKSQNNGPFRMASCYNGPCDDYAGISYIVLP
jgi:hypothetical protein